MQIDMWACVWSGHACGIHLLIRNTKDTTVLYVHNKHGCLSWGPRFVIMLDSAFLSNQNLPFHLFSFYNLWHASAAAKFTFDTTNGKSFLTLSFKKKRFFISNSRCFKWNSEPLGHFLLIERRHPRYRSATQYNISYWIGKVAVLSHDTMGTGRQSEVVLLRAKRPFSFFPTW